MYIDKTATVDAKATIGEGTYVWNWSKVREQAVIGKDCIIGQCTYIDAQVVIGDGCKIQNGAQIYHGVVLADRVFVGPNVTFSNDKYPRAFDPDWKIVKTNVEEGATIGAGAVIVCGVNLGRYCMVAAGTLVTKDVPAYGLVLGQPARLVDYVDVKGMPIRHDMSKPFTEDLIKKK